MYNNKLKIIVLHYIFHFYKKKIVKDLFSEHIN